MKKEIWNYLVLASWKRLSVGQFSEQRRHNNVCLRGEEKRWTAERKKDNSLEFSAVGEREKDRERENRLQSATIKMKMTQQLQTADEAAVREPVAQTGGKLS